MNWLSYSPADFLMFGPEVFFRLYIRLNEDIWPWQWLSVALVVAIGLLLPRAQRWARCAILLLLCVGWLWSGVGFLLGYYQPINWPAGYFGWAFITQAVGLVAAAIFARRFLPERVPHWPGPRLVLGWLLIMAASPWLVVLETGSWRSVALFATTPDLTVLGSVLCLLLVPRQVRRLLLPIPLIWAIFSSATLALLDAWLMLTLPVAAAFVAIAGFWVNPIQVQTQD